MGGGHSDKRHKGKLMFYPDVFDALIQWVEDDITPSELPTMISDEKKEKILFSGKKEKPYFFDNSENGKVVNNFSNRFNY